MNPLDSVASSLAAPQQRPRPLPLFLELVRSETAASPERMQRVLAGLRAYQAADRIPTASAAPALAKAGRVTLRDYGGDGPPVIFVPSLINPPAVLDLTPETSLLRWLAARGVRPLLVDWGAPGPEERDLDVAGHVERLLLPLIDAVGTPVSLVGYCLGGTMALAAAALRPVRALALLATPWRFAGFPDDARTTLAGLWEEMRPVADRLGAFPMEVLQAAFWRIDPARTIGKFEQFADLPAGSDAARGFVALEDWANDGPPLTPAAARELLVDLFGRDRTGTRAWRVADRTVNPAALTCPILNVVARADRIVPAASAVEVGERLDLTLGHVGMIVSRRAPDLLWEPLRQWLVTTVAA